ncbi:unnamed protein product [Effrenium voratum]|uniref:FH2 domain-containing protein n=2 Tax=Effrenium voratum TaxID=2562239 RepID=A0AA36HY62_9DINO|nr:unnamed protein product [Effrenium voratum]CAJ1451766.1 unnamed protein product [Effrenium voratum]
MSIIGDRSNIIADRTINELRGNVSHLQKDIESRAATIQHLQQALKAKSQTIEILQRNAKAPGSDNQSLEAYIQQVVEEKCRSQLAAKDEEVNCLMELLHEKEDQLAQAPAVPAPAVPVVSASEQAELEELQAELARLRNEADADSDDYGTDDLGQDEWAEMLKAKHFQALFMGAETVGENASRAASDLQEHVHNITASLEFFPQMNPHILEELDRKGHGWELRKFLLIMQKATDRALRIASVLLDLSEKSAEVTSEVKSLLRLKYLEWHLKSLRMAGQHEVLLRFQKNLLAAQKADYEDVLDQYGSQCEQNAELEDKVKSLETKLEEFTKNPQDDTKTVELEKEVQELRSQLESSRKQVEMLELAKTEAPENAQQESDGSSGHAIKGKGKGKKGPGPPPPPTEAASEAVAENEPEGTETATEQAPADGDASNPPEAAKAKSKGKGKKGPGPPPPPTKAASEAIAENEGQGAEATEQASAGKGGKPAAPAKGKAKGKGKSALPDVAPGPEPPKELVGKKFHWTNVLGNRFPGSMFEKIVADLNNAAKPEEKSEELDRTASTLRVKLDMSALTSFFFKKKEEEAGAVPEAKDTKKKSVAQCLNAKRSQAVEIFLNGCGVNISHVKSAVLDLDDKVMNVDNLGKVIDFYPQGEELQELVDFKANNDPAVLPWGRAEEFLLQLMEMPDFKSRAESCLTRNMFEAEFGEVAKDVNLLDQCLSSVVNSKWLPNVFALVMQIGNYLNHGTNKGSQRGFTLDTLPLLTRVEGFEDKTYSLIRFIMDTLEADRKVKDGALEDLKLCEDASKLDFDESVRRLNELEKRVTTVEALLEQGEPGENDRFHEAMQGFVKDARERLSKLREQVEQVQTLSKQCCDLFAEKPKTPSPETLGKLAAFRKDMEDARRQNLMAKVKKEKAEKRKAEQKEKAQARKQSVAEAASPAASKPAAPTPEATENLPPAEASPPKVRTMQVKVPEPCLVHKGDKRSAVHTSLLREALALATTMRSAPGGRASLEPSRPAGLERKTMGHPGGRQTFDPSMSRGSDQAAILAELRRELRKVNIAQVDDAPASAEVTAAPEPRQSLAEVEREERPVSGKLLEVEHGDLPLSTTRHTMVLEGECTSGHGSVGPADAVNGLKALDSGPSSSGSLLELPHQAKAAVGRNSFGGDFLTVTKSGRLSVGPRTAAALAAKEALEEAVAQGAPRESLAEQLRQVKDRSGKREPERQKEMEETNTKEEEPILPRESLAAKVRQAREKK